MSQTRPHILRRIQEAKYKGLDALDLSFKAIRIALNQIPPELFELRNLKHLNFEGWTRFLAGYA